MIIYILYVRIIGEDVIVQVTTGTKWQAQDSSSGLVPEPTGLVVRQWEGAGWWVFR